MENCQLHKLWTTRHKSIPGAEQMAQAWRRVKLEGGNYELNKAKFEVEADKIYQELGLNQKRLEIEEEKLIKDYIVGILQSGVQLYKR